MVLVRFQRSVRVGKDPDDGLAAFLEPADDGEEVGAVSVDGGRALELAGLEGDLIGDGPRWAFISKKRRRLSDRVGANVAESANLEFAGTRDRQLTLPVCGRGLSLRAP